MGKPGVRRSFDQNLSVASDDSEDTHETREVETGRFWSGHFLVVSSQRFFFRAATSWILGRASSQETDGSKS